ncbi:MAG: hypothetical protein J0M23_02350 [Rickettsiales bacterium]|nr:hypothetical protein [Rickettsiales bacterium]
MTGLLFFCYLQGDWDIERQIIDQSSSLSNAGAKGRGSVIKEDIHILNYQESLEVKWSNGFVSKAKKKYHYILDSSGNLGLYSCEQGSRHFMFNLLFDSSLTAIVSGNYKCNQDFYSTTYEIVNSNQFIQKFKVNGPRKDYIATSCFVRVKR